MIKAYLTIAMILAFADIFCVSISGSSSLQELPDDGILNNSRLEGRIIAQDTEFDIFTEAERVTGCPAEILRGIAGVESHFTVTAIGDEGWSHGMFQLHSRWHDSRVKRYGEFDPFDPADAAVIAGYVIQENLRLLGGNLRLAIAAYRQGVAGVNRNGAADWYVDKVICWREDTGKVFLYNQFQVSFRPVKKIVSKFYFRGII
jgi:hypothetical protein